MVAEAVQPGNGWMTRPDIVRATEESKAAMIELERIAVVSPHGKISPDEMRKRSLKALEARRSSALKRFEEKMAEPVKGHKPQVIEIRAGDVKFDDRYQTAERYDENRARKIAAEWDWNKLLPISLNIRPEDFGQTPWCPDGHHRTAAAIMRFGPDVLIPALLHRVTYTEEAAMFAHQDENRKRVSDALKFNAGKEAGETMPLEAQGIADRLGLKLGSQAGVRQVATKTFLELVRMKGPRNTEDALRFILDRWDGETESLDARMMKGVTFFLDRYRDHPNFTASRFTKILTNVSVTAIMQEASGMRIAGAHKQIAAALVIFYNYKRFGDNRLPEWGSR